jgi:chromosome segregation ATPase
VAGSKSDTGMQRQLGEAMRKSAMLESQLTALKSENEQLKTTVARLEGFKKTITESENGDVIINLTTLNQRLKDQIELLQASLRNAEKQNATLTTEKAEVQRKLTASITENERLTNENLELKVKAIEKDSAIASLLERLEKSEAELKDCSKKVKKSKKKVSDEIEEPKKPKKKKRTDDVPLFDE